MGDERSARIERQHSQEMALRYLALLGNTPVPNEIKKWTDWFQRDLQYAVDVSTLGVVSADTENGPVKTYLNPVNNWTEISPEVIERFDREVPPHSVADTTTHTHSLASSEFKELLIKQLVKRMTALPKDVKKDVRARLVSLGAQNPTTPEETFRQLDSQKLIYMESFISDLQTKVNP